MSIGDSLSVVGEGMRYALVHLGVWCVGRSWCVGPLVGVCVCNLHKISCKFYVIACSLVSVCRTIADYSPTWIRQSLVYARCRCVGVGCVPNNTITCYGYVVDLLCTLDYCDRLSFHFGSSSRRINAAVHTIQKEKNIRVGLKID